MQFPNIPSQVAERLAYGGAGALGAALALAFLPNTSWAQRVAAILAGFACASWFTAPAVRMAGLDAELSHGLAFVIGILGMNIVEAIAKVGRVISQRAPRVTEQALEKALDKALDGKPTSTDQKKGEAP